MPAKLNIIGQTFGRGKVIGEAESKKTPSGQRVFRSLLLCECGTEYVAQNWHLRAGAILSCGCLNRDRIAARSTRHGYTKGGTKPRIYRIWRAMRYRCYNHSCKTFKHYGGRGITVCKEWENFEQFLSDMGEGKPGWTLERLDNEKGYCLENCCWATPTQQGNNRRTNRRLIFRGQIKTVGEWARLLGIECGTIFSRLKRGWNAEMALTVPANPKYWKDRR